MSIIFMIMDSGETLKREREKLLLIYNDIIKYHKIIVGFIGGCAK